MSLNVYIRACLWQQPTHCHPGVVHGCSVQEEREKSSEALFTEIAKDVAVRCVNPDTNRPYPIAQIERAMKDMHFSVQPTQAAKKQALEVIKVLKETIPIERAQMRLSIRLPKAVVRTCSLWC